MSTTPTVPPRRFKYPLPAHSERKVASFIYTALGVVVPMEACCPDHTSPMRALLDSFYARSPLDVWKASRGFGGKTHLISTLGVCEAALLGADVSILGGSGEQSRRVLDTVRTFCDRPSIARALSEPPTTHVVRFRNGGRLTALMASQKSIRGPHPQRLLLDEVDEMDFNLFKAALGQPMGKPGIPAGIVASSTHQHADKTMTKVLEMARKSAAGPRKWTTHEWCYRATMRTDALPWNWLDPQDVADKQGVVPAGMWATEYEGQEPNPESRAFDPAALDRMFQGEPINYKLGEYLEFEAPLPGETYYTGIDWALEVDRTVITTIKAKRPNWKVVAFEAARKTSWPDMMARAERRSKRFPGKICHDQTGVGNVMEGFKTFRADGFLLVGRPRFDLLTNYVTAVERGEGSCPNVDLIRDEHRYASAQDLYGGSGTFHLPDTVCSLALARYAAMGKPAFAWGRL